MDYNRQAKIIVKVGKGTYEVYEDTALLKELEELATNYSKVSASLGEVKTLGTGDFENMFKQSIISLNHINGKNRDFINEIFFPQYQPFTNYNGHVDKEYCRLELLRNLLITCDSFANLYMQVEKNAESPILESFNNLKYKIYENNFSTLVDIDALYLDLDLYNWLIEIGLVSKPRQPFPSNEKYIYKKDMSEHFANNGKYIVERIRDSVQQSSVNNTDFKGEKYSEYYNIINMRNPLDDKYAYLALDVKAIMFN